MTACPPIQVLVAGAGPTGLTLACELARRGISVRIVDQAPAPSQHSKALGIQPRSLELLHKLDIAIPMVRQGQPFYGLNLYADGHRLVHVGMDLMDTNFPYILCLPQSDTERHLTDRLSSLGIQVERPVQVAGLKQDGDGVMVTLEAGPGNPSPEETRVPWLVGCDGAHSFVRKVQGLPFEGEAYEETFFLGDLTVDWALPHDEAHIFLAPQGPLAIFPLTGNGRFRLIVGVGPDDLPGHEEPTLKDFERWVGERAGWVQARLFDPVWLARFRIHRRIVSSYRVGRVFLAGDAAHIHSPIGGQGMNTGIQDAFNLGWKLALVVKGEAPEKLLDSYQEERRPIGVRVLAGTDLATQVVTLRLPLLQHLRNALASLLMQFEAVQHRLVRAAADFEFHYRRSPIIGEDRAPFFPPRTDPPQESPGLGSRLDFRAGPAAGEHAPDVIIMHQGKGAPLHLHDLLRRPEHVLFLFDGEVASAEGYGRLASIDRQMSEHYAGRIRTLIVVLGHERPAGLPAACSVLLDPNKAVHRRYGASSQCLYLIRPDGYIGYRCQPADGGHLAAYLGRLFV